MLGPASHENRNRPGRSSPESHQCVLWVAEGWEAGDNSEDWVSTMPFAVLLALVFYFGFCRESDTGRVQSKKKKKKENLHVCPNFIL